MMVLAFIVGVLVTVVFAAVIFGRIASVFYDRMREVEATNFELKADLEHEKLKRVPVYQVPVGGVNPVAQRNPEQEEGPEIELEEWGEQSDLVHDLKAVFAEDEFLD